MIVVIQCAATKRPEAGSFRDADGRRVMFVAQPDEAPHANGVVYARPDDLSGSGGTWRERLLVVNDNPANNPDKLLPAAELYANPVYAALVRKLGIERLFILSAGWGLVPASFLLPAYDITFSGMADTYKRRKSHHRYADFRLLPDDAEGPILFFGSSSYLTLFASLTHGAHAPRIVFYNTAVSPNLPDCTLLRYATATRTNWHYEPACDLLEDRLTLA